MYNNYAVSRLDGYRLLVVCLQLWRNLLTSSSACTGDNADRAHGEAAWGRPARQRALSHGAVDGGHSQGAGSSQGGDRQRNKQTAQRRSKTPRGERYGQNPRYIVHVLTKLLKNNCFRTTATALLLHWFVDVLALAAAISELTVHTRRARTAQWCSLQMSSNDMPAECRRVIDSATNSDSPKQRLMQALQAREHAAAAAANAAAAALLTSSPSMLSATSTPPQATSPLLAGDANNNMK